MGSILVCIGCYCCLFTLKPMCVEIMALIANLFEIGFLIWGIIDIPWDDLNKGSKICFYVTCGLVVLSFLLLLILMCFRCSKTINTSKNRTGYCISITDLIVDILAFILIIVSEGLILYKMWDIDDDLGYLNHRRNRRYDSYFSDTEWACVVISLSAAEIAILVHTYCISFLSRLIYLKTNLSYKEYMDSIEPNNNEISFPRAVNVFQSPPNYDYNNNNLTFLGYDKDGHPIYSGNTTYQIINTPVITNQNLNMNNKNINNNVIDNNIGIKKEDKK